MANDIARKLRKSMTPQEVKLWVKLRELRPLGFHFRRQVPLKGYIVDFACLKEKFIIEVDGGQHAEDEHAGRDAVRDAELSEDGFRIHRIWNNEVDSNLNHVMDEIVHRLENDE